MPTTQLPGFQDPVHEAQQTFRALLDALARPGMAQTTAAVTPPAGLTSGCAAACLTLLDLETVVWLQPEISAPAKSWLLFHTGCRFTEQPQSADFALISTIATMPPLDQFNWGTAAYPEASTSLLVQLPSLQGPQAVTLSGPGILASITIQTPLSQDFLAPVAGDGGCLPPSVWMPGVLPINRCWVYPAPPVSPVSGENLREIMPYVAVKGGEQAILTPKPCLKAQTAGRSGGAGVVSGANQAANAAGG